MLSLSPNSQTELVSEKSGGQNYELLILLWRITFFCFVISIVVVFAALVLDGWICTKVSSRRNG